jgi:hypothetical protein
VPGDLPVCAPIDPRGKSLGEECWHYGDQDDCKIGLACAAADVSSQGICREICGCGPEAPTCEKAPQTVCALDQGAFFPVCVPACDPDRSP